MTLNFKTILPVALRFLGVVAPLAASSVIELSAQTYQYDLRDRLIGVEAGEAYIQFTYDPAGNIERIEPGSHADEGVQITLPPATIAVEGNPFSASLTMEGSPATLALSGLPEGLSFTPATRSISGTPTASGRFSIIASGNVNGAPFQESLELTVLPEVPFLWRVQPDDLTLQWAQGGTLWAEGSDPTATYQWYQNGTAVPGATGRSLSLPGHPSSVGSYTVRAVSKGIQYESSAARVAVGPDLESLEYLDLPVFEVDDIAYGNGLWVVVGYTGSTAVIYTSEDGFQWSPASFPASKQLYGVDFGGDRFVAVGEDGLILASLDGRSWSKQSIATTQWLTDVTYAVGTWIAVGESGLIGVSEDGFNWSKPASGTSQSLYGVAHDSNEFVAVGQNGTLLRSSDGYAWVAVTGVGFGSSQDFRDVAFGDMQWVLTTTTGGIFTSNNLTSWTARTSSTTEELWCVRYLADRFIAVGDEGVILTSVDGTAWERRVSGTTYFLKGIETDGSKTITAGERSTLFTSTEGTIWRNNEFSAVDFISVAAGPNRFLALDANGALFYSSDARNWHSSSVRVAASLRKVFWLGDRFVALSSEGYIITSPDGVEWTVRFDDDDPLNGAVYAAGIYLVVGDDGTILRSINGINWTSASVATSSDFYGVAYFDGAFYTIGTSGAAYQSTNGINWTDISGQLNSNASFYALHVDEDQLVAVASGGTVAILTTNGEWSVINPLSSTASYHSVVNIGGVWFVAATNELITSSDLVNWNQVDTGLDEINSLTYGSATLLVGSSSGDLFVNAAPDRFLPAYVLLESLQAGVSASLDSSATVSATVFEGTNTVDRLDFMVNGEIYSTDQTAPFETTLILDQPITYLVQARAVDSDGNSFYSNAVARSAEHPELELRGGRFAEDIEDIAYGNGLLVAVTDNGEGTVFVSGNGKSWNRYNVGSSVPLYGIAYGAGWFVAIGEDGFIARSQDGIAWERVGNLSTTRWLSGICYGASGFVAVGERDLIVSSPDGENWQVRSSGVNRSRWDVHWNGDRYVAVGDQGSIISSLDGSTWSVESSGTTTRLYGVSFGGGVWLACGASGLLLESSDGIIWSPIASGVTRDLWTIEFKGTSCLVAGSNGTLLFSEDRSNWSQLASNTTSYLNGLATVGGVFWAVGNGGALLYSTDLNTWNPCLQYNTNDAVTAMASSHEIIVRGTQLGSIEYSLDGRHWLSTGMRGSSALIALEYGHEKFVGLFQDGRVVSSPNGLVWNTEAYLGPTVRALSSTGGGFIVVGDDGAIWQSANLVDWESKTIGVEDFGSVCSSLGVSVASVRGLPKVYYSADGDSWTLATIFGQGAINDIVLHDDQFFASGDGGFIYSSRDGRSWVPSTVESGIDLESLTSIGSLIYAAGESGKVFVSDTGYTWNPVESPTSAWLYAVGGKEGSLAFAGDDLRGGSLKGHPETFGIFADLPEIPEAGIPMGTEVEITFNLFFESDSDCSFEVWNGDQLVESRPAASELVVSWLVNDLIPDYLYAKLRVDNEVVALSDVAFIPPVIELPVALDAEALEWTSGGSGEWFGQVFSSFDGIDAAQSPTLNHNQESWMQTTVEGPVELSFSWAVSSELNGDWLEFYINGVRSDRISGNVNWQAKQFELSAGTHVLRWVYKKDSSAGAGLDTAWVDFISIAPVRYEISVESPGGNVLIDPDRTEYEPGESVVLTAVPDAGNTFLRWDGDIQNSNNPVTVVMNDDLAIQAVFALSLGEALDSPDRLWLTGGSSPWFGQTGESYDLTDSAQSGAIGNSTESWFETTVRGPAEVSFWWKVSSESGYDFLEFLINGALQPGRISGNVSWTNQTFSLQDGEHTLRWRYRKDGSATGGSDAAWVDRVVIQTQTKFDDWMLNFFTIEELEDGLLGGLYADADKDGLLNLLEYALGKSPAVNDADGLLVARLRNGIFEFDATCRADDPALTFVCAVSQDLNSWTEVTLSFDTNTDSWSASSSEVEIASQMDLGNGIWKLTLRDASGFEPVFVRMKVTYTP